MTDVQVTLADLNDPVQQAAVVELLDMYARDEFGSGQPLAAEARNALVPGLVRHGARVYLASRGEQPLGLAICFAGFSTFRARPLLNIHDLAVRPEARGLGIGRLLLARIEADARELGYCRVTLEVRADNARAQGLYRRMGFRPSEPETWFWTRPLDGSPSTAAPQP